MPLSSAALGVGLSAPQAAEHLRLSPEHRENPPKHGFDKTGVRSQVELARLLALMPGHSPRPSKRVR